MTKKFLSMICVLIMMSSFIATSANAARVGDVVGYAQPTNIVATINGYQLESYNVDGYTYICAEDLRYYGFDVYYDNASRALYVSRNNGVSSINPQNSNPKFWEIGSNSTKRKILYTDITTYVNGNYVPSCNINGQTIIQFEHLGAFGGVSYDDNRREISLVMGDVVYNPVALFAIGFNENIEVSDDWTSIVRAKGDVLVIIGTARSYMDKNSKNYYINNNFSKDKEGTDEIYEACVENNIPVSSVYLELRNSDGTLITSYQTK